MIGVQPRFFSPEDYFLFSLIVLMTILPHRVDNPFSAEHRYFFPQKRMDEKSQNMQSFYSEKDILAFNVFKHTKFIRKNIINFFNTPVKSETDHGYSALELGARALPIRSSAFA
jgi:hypothetical protein